MTITIILGINIALLPLFFLGGLCFTHSVLGVYSKKDPQIAQIIFSKLRLMKNKIPNRLVV
jgi:hypothetical protein